MSDWIDVTRPMDDTLMLWPGRVGPIRKWDKTIAAGHHCNVSEWQFNSHTGTHMDAPMHFFDFGVSIDRVSPDIFLGPCVVIDIGADGIVTEEMAKELAGEQRILVRTSHSHASAQAGYPAHEALMTKAASSLLVDGGLALIGTDRLSVDDSRGESFALHREFLGRGCVIVEGLQLQSTPPGRYDLVAVPLRLSGADASPCRALLLPT